MLALLPLSALLESQPVRCLRSVVALADMARTVSPLPRSQVAVASRSAAGAALSTAEQEEAQEAARAHEYSEAAAAAAQHLRLEREELDAARRHEQCRETKVGQRKSANRRLGPDRVRV